jgi:hypothetical protein
VAVRAVLQEKEEFSVAAFVAGEGNWWSGKKKRKRRKTCKPSKYPVLLAFLP